MGLKAITSIIFFSFLCNKLHEILIFIFKFFRRSVVQTELQETKVTLRNKLRKSIISMWHARLRCIAHIQSQTSQRRVKVIITDRLLQFPISSPLQLSSSAVTKPRLPVPHTLLLGFLDRLCQISCLFLMQCISERIIDIICHIHTFIILSLWTFQKSVPILLMFFLRYVSVSYLLSRPSYVTDLRYLSQLLHSHFSMEQKTSP